MALADWLRGRGHTVRHMRDGEDRLPREDRFALPHGIELGVRRQLDNNRDNVKYKVLTAAHAEGRLPVSDLADKIQFQISKKTNKPSIQERAGQYAEWSLALTDPHRDAASLYDDEVRTVTDAIHYGAPWRRVILVNLASDKVSQVIDLTKAGV